MSSTTWETHRHRADALRRAVRLLDDGRPTEVPWDDELAGTFDSPDDVLLALQDLWSRWLLGRVDLALEIDAQPAESSVALAWHEVATELSGVRRLLDRYGDHPALRRSVQHEHRMLAVAAGLAALADPPARSARAGQRLVAGLRDARVAPARAARLTDRVAALVRRVPTPVLGARLGG